MNQDDKEINEIIEEGLPLSTLDLQLRLTNPKWSEKQVNEFKIILDQYITRDLRLANLDTFQTRYCEYWLTYASDLLSNGMNKSFLAALRRVIHTLELSQSYKGFLRKRGNSTRIESVRSDFGEKKKGIFGNKRGESDYYDTYQQ